VFAALALGGSVSLVIPYAQHRAVVGQLIADSGSEKMQVYIARAGVFAGPFHFMRHRPPVIGRCEYAAIDLQLLRLFCGSWISDSDSAMS
jgi:hypothetical protein